MKSAKLVIFTIAFLGFYSSYSQDSGKVQNTPASDAAAGYTYDYDITTKLIFDRIVKPSEANADVQPLLEAPDFPSFKGKTLNEDYKAAVREWMEKNSTLIINSLKHRKDIVTPF